jgi:alcohol dehydrogenase class IV
MIDKVSNMQNFQFHLPVNLIFGAGTVSRVGEIASGYGKRALVVTGRSSTKKSGLLERVIKLLAEAGVESYVYDKVSANPLTTTAEEAAVLAQAKECDLVVGIGGGSIMDCTKAAAFIAVNHSDINDYIYGRKTGTEALPIILIPTTCGTGSEGNGFAVLTNPQTNDKKSLRCNAIIAKASIIDPEVMQTMPKSVMASVGFDALCHCIEAYLSRNATPLTDAWCLWGMDALAKHLPKLYEGSTNPEDWSNVTLASTIGGMTIGLAGVTLAHAMEHPASGLRNIVHGEGLAALTPVIMEMTAEAAPEKCGMISRILGGSGAEDCAERIRSFLREIGLERTLSQLGIAESDIGWMAENCLKVSAAGVSLHPVVVDVDGIREIYKKAL